MPLRIGRTLPPAAIPIRFKEIAAGVAGCFRSGAVKAFEEEIQDSYSVRHCFAVSSGKAALVLILQALHELSPQRDEVLVPAYTCYSVPSAIVRAGLKVRLCDISPESLDFDFECLKEQLDNPHLLCVVPTHLFGLPADVARVNSLAGQRSVFVLEDAAQAMGGEHNGEKIGTLGDVGFFSLGRGKAFSTVEGGLILTDNPLIGRTLERRLGEISSYGALECIKLVLYAVALSTLIHPWIYWLPKALPFLKLGETHFDTTFPIRRLSPFQAGMAKGWSAKIAGLKALRAKNVQKMIGYGLKPPGFSGETIPDLIRFPVLVADAARKKTVLEQSEASGLGMAGGYPDSLDGVDELGSLSEGRRFPGAKACAARLVSLPVHSFVAEGDIAKFVNLLVCNRSENYVEK